MNSAPPQTAPTAVQEPQRRYGACSCGAASLNGCVCPWGDLIREMMRVGYHCSPPAAAADLQLLPREATEVMHAHRRELLVKLGASWIGTREEFMRYFGLDKTTYYNMGIRVPLDQRRTT